MAEPKTLADIWAAYERNVMPADADSTQRRESRNCFYVGAGAVFALLMRGMSPEGEPTEADLNVCDAIFTELSSFAAEIEARAVAKRAGG